MAIGGGMGGGMFGPGGAGALRGGQTPGADQLPFAGVPSELAERVETLLDTEPDHDEPDAVFSHHDFDRQPFTFRRFLAPFWLPLLGVLALMIVEVVALQSGPLLTQIVIDRGIADENTTVLAASGVAYFVFIWLTAFATTARIRMTGGVGERLMLTLRIRIFSHLQRLSLDFYTREKAGVIMTRMTSDLTSLQQLFNEGLAQLVVQAMTLVYVTVVLFLLDVQLALVTVVAVVPATTIVTLWYRRASARGYLRVRERIGEVLAHLSESLAGVRVVTAHNRAVHNNVEHRNVVGDYRRANYYTARVDGTYGPVTNVIGILGQAVIVLVGGNMVLDGTLSVGELAAFVLFLTAFFAPIQQLVQLYNTYQEGQAAMAKLRGLLAIEPSVPEQPDAEPLPPIDGEIRLDQVTFGYDPARPVLWGVDLHVGVGETFALVGATGSGKSTIAKLVARFYDPTAGRITVDGHPIADVELSSLRRQLGVVPQEPFLFGGSLRDNISYARPDATKDEVLAACEAVGITDLVARLPDGLDTAVHERGVSLSAGERQLLALARAFLAQPRVLILDEATSNLDLASESKVEHALDVLLEGRTAIIIAHRLSTARRADRIAVIADGRVVEVGTHDELVALDGHYAAMNRAWEEHAGADAPAARGTM